MTSTRPITLEDADELAELRRANREFLAPWEPIRPPEFLTAAGQRSTIEGLLAGMRRREAEARVILADGRLVGQMTLTNISRGPFQSGNVGYWVSADVNGRGHATAALSELAQLAFGDLGLHRLEAGTLAHNAGSQRVLERNGFERIGVARAYLRIGGRWQDHVLFQLIAQP